MKSALFVDFDNVFSQLRQVDPEAAERFARHPNDWLQWLAASLALPEPHAEGDRRRLLVRRCYLNPNWYQSFRHAFLRAGFEVIDCPPVTAQGKTSTDIHMVLDMVELLQHETGYEEFIVFSADADFTPVLRKLRRYDRRTTVLAIGYPSAAYQASADLLIDERQFVTEVLAAKAGTDTPGADAPPRPVPTADRAPPKPASPSTDVASAAASPSPPPRLLTEAEVDAAAEVIVKAIDDAPQFLSGGALATRLKLDFPFLAHWNGQGTFKNFYKSLGIARLVWFSGSGGRLLDPSKHYVRGEMSLDADSPWAGHEAAFEVVADVCESTKAPMFAPAQLALVLRSVAEDLEEHPFQLGPTGSRVVDRCKASGGLRVRRRDITFLLRGLQMTGHAFGVGRDDLETLKQQLTKQILFLCEREQLPLTDASVAFIRQWIGMTPATTTPSQ